MRYAYAATVFGFLLCARAAGAETFSNSYLSFSLPNGWACGPEDTEFLCKPPSAAGGPTDAIMILTAKLPGPDDTLNSYRAHLSEDPPATGKGTIVIKPAFVTIRGTIWVDATLLGSELPDYYTRYLATIKDGVAVLYTFSAHRNRFDSLSSAALMAIETLNVRYEANRQ